MLAECIHLRDAGIKQAVDHANDVSPGWSERAYEALAAYSRMHRTFTGEQVRSYASAIGLELPPDNRAWGGVFTRAAKRGLIRKQGYSTSHNPEAHMRPITVWESL